MLTNTIDEIISGSVHGAGLKKEEIIRLLEINGQAQLEKLFSAARAVRERIFSDKVFLYGFVYFSTFCRNNCNFCYYRRENDIPRYRKDIGETVQIAEKLARSGVHLIDLTMGEDFLYHRENFASVLKIIEKTKEKTNLPVMVSPGVVGNSFIDKFSELKAEWYALYQETHNRELFKSLRLSQDYDERMKAKLYAKEKGMLIEEGILVGVGESLQDIADSIMVMGDIGASQVRVMSFVPQEGIPMEKSASPDRSLELKIIAILRLMYPNALIPASLDVEGISGLKVRMDAGANVITSIIPPREGLMGVAQNKKDVDDGGRTVDEVVSILSDMGLKAATADEYREYLRTIKRPNRY